MWSKYGKKCFFQRFGLYLSFAVGASIAIAWTRDSKRDDVAMLALVFGIQPFNFFYLWVALDAICSKNYPRHLRFYYVDVMTHSMVLIFSLFVLSCFFSTTCGNDIPNEQDDSFRSEMFDCVSALTAVLIWIKTTKYLLVEKHTGPLVVVLFTILTQDLISFALVSLVFFVGYTFAFYIILVRSLPDFSSPWLSSITTVNMFFWHGAIQLVHIADSGAGKIRIPFAVFLVFTFVLPYMDI